MTKVRIVFEMTLNDHVDHEQLDELKHMILKGELQKEYMEDLRDEGLEDITIKYLEL